MKRLTVLTALGGVTSLLLASAHAQQPGIGDESGAALLAAAARAAQEQSYSGTQFVVFWAESGSTAAVVQVSHTAGEGSILRVDPTPQSPGGSVIHGDTFGLPGGAGIAADNLALLTRNYEAVRMGTDSVVGRTADLVVVRRPGSSPSARFWIDRDTRLVLRREVLDTNGQTLEASSFVALELRQAKGPVLIPKSPGGLMHAVKRTASGDAITRDPVTFANWRRAGWVMPEELPGGLELLEARASGAGDQRVVHMSYSDGISTVSLFQQRGRLDSGGLVGWQKSTLGKARVWVMPAFPRRVVWAGGGKVFTLVADCQQPVLQDIVTSLPHTQHRRGLLGRVGRGLARVGSWFNPFA